MCNMTSNGVTQAQDVEPVIRAGARELLEANPYAATVRAQRLFSYRFIPPLPLSPHKTSEALRIRCRVG